MPSAIFIMSTEPNKDIVTDDPKWTEGDFTLISSDGVSFKASSQILFLCR